VGQPLAGPGRPKGAINIATRELKEMLQQFFSSEEYRQSIKARIIAGTAPTCEIYLLQLLYGKPKESVDLRVGPLEGEEDLSTLSTAELVERLEGQLRQLREVQELEAAIPAEVIAQFRIEEASHEDASHKAISPEVQLTVERTPERLDPRNHET